MKPAAGYRPLAYSSPEAVQTTGTVVVRDQIDAFIKAYNQTAHPFEWTKQVVFSQHPRAKYADLCN
jgi:hypothetical protein